MYYVYVLKSEKTGDYYKGYTLNLRKRLEEHNGGVTESTKTGVPWNLVYYEAFTNKRAARKEELFLKSGKGRERLKYLLDDLESGQDGNALVSKTSSRKG